VVVECCMSVMVRLWIEGHDGPAQSIDTVRIPLYVMMTHAKLKISMFLSFFIYLFALLLLPK
jgi:hypothetical protein